MAERFPRFTKSTRRVLQEAQVASQQHGDWYIGTDHLVAGLVKEGSAFDGLSLNTTQARLLIDKMMGLPQSGVVNPDVGLTHQAKIVLTESADRADTENSEFIRPIHLLDAIRSTRGSIGAAILEEILH